jgi:hypothetical protein
LFSFYGIHAATLRPAARPEIGALHFSDRFFSAYAAAILTYISSEGIEGKALA